MLKRLFDFVMAFAALALLFPLVLFVSLLVFFKLGRPIIFRQERPGLNGKPFIMIKFRTMIDVRSSDGDLLPDGARLTKFGKLLRSTSLDELPELWNVLRGDMSIVGPRPLHMRYLQRYSREQARRHEVRPGVTGLAQIKGRNSLNWVDRFKLDVWYVDNRSFYLDLKIILLTISKVVRREGVSSKNHATMKEFYGEDNE